MGEGKKCPKCDALNVPGAIICSLCGEALVDGAAPGSAPEGRTTARPSGGTRSAAVKGFWVGLLCAGVMFPIGLILTLTGIGALIGVPLIIGSFMAPSVVSGCWAAARRREISQEVRGRCPYCEEDLISSGTGVGPYICPTCGQRVLRRGGEFITLERARRDSAPFGS